MISPINNADTTTANSTPTSATVSRRYDTLIELIANTAVAYHNCVNSKNTEWERRHAEALHQIAKDLLPSGSGIDTGSYIDVSKSNADKIVLGCSFHHMDEGGGYDGWTEHLITLTPSFIGRFDISVSGRNRNDIKEFLAETFSYVLMRPVTVTYDPATERTTYIAR